MMVMDGSPGTPGCASDPPWRICHAESSTSGRLWVGRQTTSAPGMPAIPNAVSSDATRAPNGIDGRKSGTAEGYSYSDANKNSGITWNKEQFLEYIKDPKAKIPGTKMIFPGIKNEKAANDL